MLKELLQGKPTTQMEWLAQPTLKRIGLCIVVIILGCGFYGATVGCWRSPLMGLYVGIKFPLLIFLTLACNGFLNGVLGMILGSGLGFKQSLLALLMSFTVLAVALGALAPVTLYFAWNSPSADSAHSQVAHSALLLIHTGVIAYTGVLANLHLYRYLKSYCSTVKIARMTLLSWLGGNAFVGAQFSWILRPFFGSPNLEVAFLREDPMNGTFYGSIGRSLETVYENSGLDINLFGLVAVISAAMAFYLSTTKKYERKHKHPK